MRRFLLVFVVACGGKGSTPVAPKPELPPPPPPGSQFICNRTPLSPAISWHECTRTAALLQEKAECFTARTPNGSGQTSICAPLPADCQMWHDARVKERNDVISGCVPMRAGDTIGARGKQPSRDASFSCEREPDPRRMVMWRECKTIEAEVAPSVACFVVKKGDHRASICAANLAECSTWEAARRGELNDVAAACAPTALADFWPL